MRNFDHLTAIECRSFQYYNRKNRILSLRSFLIFTVLWCFANPGYSQTFSVSASEIFTNGNSDETNNLAFIFDNIQECITSNIVLEICIRGDIDGDYNANCAAGMDESAELIINGVATGLHIGNSDEAVCLNNNNPITEGTSTCVPYCKTLVIPYETAVLAVADGSLTIVLDANSRVNNAVNSCGDLDGDGIGDQFRFAAEIVSLTYSASADYEVFGQLVYCESDAAGLISVDAHPGITGSFIEIPGLSDNGDNTATFDPSISGPGTFYTSYYITCNDLTYAQDIIIEVFGSPTDLAISPQELCSTSTSALLSVSGNGFGNAESMILWSSSNENVLFLDNSGGDARINVLGLDEGLYEICVDINDGGLNCFEPFQYCEEIEITSGNDLLQSVTLEVNCASNEIGNVALSQLFPGLSNATLATSDYNVSGGVVVGGTFIYNDFGCFEVQVSGNVGPPPCFEPFNITSYVLVSESPDPQFAVQNQICWSDGAPAFEVTPLVLSNNYSGDVIRSWSFSGDDITGGSFNSENGSFTVSGTGIMTLTLVETLTTSAGNCAGTAECSEEYSQVIYVEDGTSLDASFTASNINPCIGEEVTLTPVANGGVFTGAGVSDNGLGTGAVLNIADCNPIAVSYILNTPNGCTNAYTLIINPDPINPAIVAPASIQMECDGSDFEEELAAWLESASVLDNCMAELTSELISTTSSCGSSTQYLYRFDAVDDCGNRSIDFGTFTIIDNTPPSLTILENPGPVSCELADPDAWAASAASGEDICGFVDITYVQVGVEEQCDGSFIYTYQFTATDQCGNTSREIGTYSTSDDTPPIINTDSASNLNAECNGASNGIEILLWLNNNGGLTATDNCSEVTWSNDFGNVEVDCENDGGIAVTFTATDACGNSSAETLMLNISDNEGPVWNILPTNINLECASADPLNDIMFWLATNGGGQAIDDCSIVRYENDFEGLFEGCNSGTGNATVTFFAIDACGNRSEATAMVTITDNVGPEIVIPANDTIVVCDALGNENDLQSWLSNNGGASATDLCGGLSWNAPELLETFQECGGNIKYIYGFSAIDDCGNSSNVVTATFEVLDNVAPTITMSAMDEIAECNGAGNTMELSEWLEINGGAEADDNCSSVTWSYDLISESDFCSPTGFGLYRFTATDECGNTAFTEAYFDIRDTQPPVIVGGSDMLMEECIDPPAGNFPEFNFWLSNNAGANATDACNNVNWSNNYNPDNWVYMCGNARYVDVIFTASDNCGNSDSFTARFGIGDVTPPFFINCPRPVITAATPDTWCEAFVNFSPPYALDNCSFVTITQIDDTGKESGDLFPVGITVLIWEARDQCGNADTCELKIVVNDYLTTPEITCPDDINFYTDSGLCGTIIDEELAPDGSLAPSVEDNCMDNIAVTYEVIDEEGRIVTTGLDNINGDFIPTGAHTVTYFVQDQPILLITEVVQSDLDSVELTNFGPASMEISCLVISRTGSGEEDHIVPVGVILAPGETYVAPLENNIGYFDPALYTIHFKKTVFDAVATNGHELMDGWIGDLNGGDVQRIFVVDHDSDTDWEVSHSCETSIGLLNYNLPIPVDNGTKTGIQTVLPNKTECSFNLTISDNEAPVCMSIEEFTLSGEAEINFESFECFEQIISFENSGPVQSIIIKDLSISYPDVGDLIVSLSGPDGSKIILFERLCDETADVHINLADTSTITIDEAICGPLGQGGWYAPSEPLSTFCNKDGRGEWKLEVYSTGEFSGVLENWDLIINTYVPYNQGNVTLEVPPIDDYKDCGAEYTWIHPYLMDNCCDGTIEVSYSSFDTDTLPQGGLVEQGSEITAFFGLGETTVTYTLTDLNGNISMCSFIVEVIDPNGYCIPPCQTLCNISCVGHINVSLDENCEAELVASMLVLGVEVTCDDYYEVKLIDINGDTLPDNLIGYEYLGQTITYKVIEPECGNSCWGTAYIEDKIAPVIQCNDLTISCMDLIVLPEPTVVENCGSYELILLNEVIEDVSCVSEAYRSVITRTYIAIDDNGMESEVCTQSLTIEKFDLTDITPPAKLEITLECGSGYQVDDSNNPHPNVTGIPTLNGVPIWPGNLEICNTYVSYEDEVFSFSNSCVTTIQRRWTIANWECGMDQTRVIGQTIRIIDSQAPQISCPSDLTIQAQGIACLATLEIIKSGITDNCNNENIRLDVSYPGGFLENTNGALIELEGGEHTITYRVIDICGNSSECSYKVTVMDASDPAAICDAGLSVSISSDGSAMIMASDIDLGSYDACGEVTTEILRMEPLAEYPEDGSFGPSLHFSCDDIGKEIMVVLRVTDENGNSNQCMVSVSVNDLVPVQLLQGLPDITVGCTFPYDPDNLEVFGKLVNHPDDREEIIITSDIVEFSGPALDGLVIDNCSTAGSSEISAFYINDCGIGYIIRTITAESPNGEKVTTQQKISFVNADPFEEADIIWPVDYAINNVCSVADYSPENLPAQYAMPTFTEDFCDMVSFTYEDQIIENTVNGGGCGVIQRTWYVSDWCQKIDDQFPVWDHIQLITLTNSTEPIIISECNDIYIESFDANCNDVFVSLMAEAIDDCVSSEHLIWSYEIDLNADGFIDQSGNSNNASGNYIVGSHIIYWTVSDGCGNIDQCEVKFDLVNGKNPTPICLNGLSVGLTPMDMDDNGSLDGEFAFLTPDMINKESYHICGYEVLLSFSADVNDTLIVFNCDDLGQQSVQLWVTDINGNQDFCSTYVIVEDNNEVEVCEESAGLVQVEGKVFTEDEVRIGQVEVRLIGSEMSVSTSENGLYRFEDMPMGGSYEVHPESDLNPMNGVSTLDLVMIQNHILGKALLDSPYKLIAADVNNSGTLTGADLIELRKMVLGLNESFPNNKSWKFVDAAYQFLNPLQPWSEYIPYTYPIFDLKSNMQVDFIGIKVGDVNDSGILNGRKNSEVRSNEGPLVLQFENQKLEKGNESLVAVYANDLSLVSGYQFTLNLNLTKVDFVDIIDGISNKTHFGFKYVDQGLITSSWNRTGTEIINSDQPLFFLKLKARSTVEIAEVLALSNAVTRSEAYTHDYEVMKVDLKIGGEQINAEAPLLFQNKPNPWADKTIVSFYLPSKTHATIIIYDLTGQLIKEIEGEFDAGQHAIELDPSTFSSNGIYYYSLITKDFRATRKMVLLK